MKVIWYDLETLKGYMLFSFFYENKWYEFEITTHGRNDMYSLVKFIRDRSDYYFCGFNVIMFDSQVLTYIIKNHQNWHSLTTREIITLIYNFSQRVIDDTNNEVFPPYREEDVPFKQIDVFQVPHFANKQRRCSLKWLEFMMDMPNIEEMPYSHTQEEFTESEIQETKDYCRNDIVSTIRWYNYLIGETSHPFYKGKNMIQDRLDVIEEFSLPSKAISFPNVKIGDELNKMGYISITGKTINEIFDLKRRRGHTRKFTYNDCIPDYIEFSTQEMKNFYDSIKNKVVSLSRTNKQEFPLTFRGTVYKIARGGIHSCEKRRIIIPSQDEILRDADIGSQYPNSIVKRKLFPSHLGEEWLVNYEGMIKTRLKYKALSEDGDRRAKGLSESFKLGLNGGGFGKTNEETSWQYDPRVTYFCTIGNQFEILMLIEMMELAGIHVVSANTDGIVCLFKKDQEPIYKQVCEEWERKVGNHEMGKLEFTDYKKLWQESVNHYIAVKSNGSVKVKGRFVIWDELHRNNTDKIERITRQAIINWVIDKTTPESTINGCNDIYMFCVGKKATKDYRFETLDKKGNRTHYKRIIRFYISQDGETLIKVKNESSDATGASITKIFNGKLVTICNRIDVANIQKVDREHYIDNAYSIIESVEGKVRNNNENQLTLF